MGKGKREGRGLGLGRLGRGGLKLTFRDRNGLKLTLNRPLGDRGVLKLSMNYRKLGLKV